MCNKAFAKSGKSYRKKSSFMLIYSKNFSSAIFFIINTIKTWSNLYMEQIYTLRVYKYYRLDIPEKIFITSYL